MARRPFVRKKKNESKNQEAIDTFNMFNRLAPSTRNKYLKLIDSFSEFLLVHRKSLWDADYEDVKKFLNETDNRQARNIISVFYRVLIDAGEINKENPVVQLNRIERELREKEAEEVQPVGRAATVIQELDDGSIIEETKVVQPKKKREVGKRIMVLSDLDNLVQKARHIRDRAILEFLYATGVQIQELVNLNISDVDLEARQVTIHQDADHFRTLVLPKRTVNFLKIYERWRRRQMSPSQAYYITKTTRKRMSDTSISTWLSRIQKDVDDREKWTSMDFRKRALLQHYWVTRDLTAIARFGGYKRPESALNLISEVLNDQGVESIDALASLPEFEALKSDSKRVASIRDEDQLTITIQLDKEEMDIIRNSGLTPTQAVKTIISLKDLYGAFSPGGAPIGGGAKPAAAGPTMTKPAEGDTPSGPKPAISGPKMVTSGGPSLGGGGPNLGGGGPNLGGPKSAGGGPNLGGPASSGPSLSGPSLSGPASGGPGSASGGGPNNAILDVKLSSAPVSDKPTGSGPGGKPPGGGPQGGGAAAASPMDQMSELRAVLQRRKKAAAEKSADEKSEAPKRPTLGGKIVDNDDGDASSSSSDDDDDKKKKDDVLDMPDFDF